MKAALLPVARLRQFARRGLACWLALLLAGGVAAGDASMPQGASSAAAPSAAVAKRRVLVIYSLSDAHPWQSKLRQGVQDVLRQASGAQVELFEEQLDTGRLGDVGYTRPLADHLRHKYHSTSLDAVITESANAAAFLLEHPSLFQDVPGFILNHGSSDTAGAQGRPIRFVSLPTDLERAVSVIPVVLPQVRHVVAVTGRTAPGRLRSQQLRALAPRLPPHIRLEVWDTFTEQDLYARAGQLRPGTAVLYMPAFADRDGRPLVPTEVARRLSAASAVPVFSHFDSLLGTGIVGGHMVSAQRLGGLIGRIALHGDLPESKQDQWQAVTGYFFDDRQLKRWAIDAQRLPAGSVILYREVPAWLAYRGTIAATLLLFGLQLALIAKLVLMMRQRNRAIADLDTSQALLEEKVALRTTELQQTNQLLSNLTAQVPGAVFQFRRFPDGRSCVPYASQGLATVLELEPEQVREDASAFFALLHPEDREEFVASFLESEASLLPWHHEFRVLLPRQGPCWRLGTAQPERLEDGSMLWHGLISDITQRKQAEDLVLHLAQHDKLTGLANRALFMDRLEQQIARARRDPAHVALVFIDLNEFKPVNDRFGHAVGDLLLQAVARRMQQCVRESDTVARIGGDEFVVLLPSAETAADAMVVAQKIGDAVGRDYELAGHRLHISASLGVALYPQHGESAELLLKSADAAMYRVKHSGQEGARLFETPLSSPELE